MWVVEGRKVCREAHKQEERSQDETGRPMHSMEFRKWVDRGWAFSSSPSFSYVFFLDPPPFDARHTQGKCLASCDDDAPVRTRDPRSAAER